MKQAMKLPAPRLGIGPCGRLWATKMEPNGVMAQIGRKLNFWARRANRP